VHRYEIAQIGRSLTVDAFESQHQDFELYAQLDRQPVKLKEHGSQMIMLISAQYDPSAGILDSLKLADLSLR